MNKLKLMLPLFFIAIIISCVDKNEYAYQGGNSLFNSDSFKTAYVETGQFKIDSISKIAIELKRLDSLQNGVCDTCVTGYQSAIIENRKVAEKLSEQTAILDRKLEKTYNQIKEADSLLASNDVQLSKLKTLNNLTNREQKKQKNEYYTLSKGD
jgi:hypothetical protein